MQNPEKKNIKFNWGKIELAAPHSHSGIDRELSWVGHVHNFNRLASIFDKCRAHANAIWLKNMNFFACSECVCVCVRTFDEPFFGWMSIDWMRETGCSRTHELQCWKLCLIEPEFFEKTHTAHGRQLEEKYKCIAQKMYEVNTRSKRVVYCAALTNMANASTKSRVKTEYTKHKSSYIMLRRARVRARAQTSRWSSHRASVCIYTRR